jgi:murein DD-endopeptidase MepM/ murein hydrolase activator NlpD
MIKINFGLSAYRCLFFAWVFLLGFSNVSRAEEERRTFLWSGDAASVESFENLCKERSLTSADVFRANNCAPLPSEGTVLIVPSAKPDVNAVWMEVLTRKNGSAVPLVSVKLHSVPRKLRANRSPAATTPVSGDFSLDSALSSLRAALSADAAKDAKPTVTAAPSAAEREPAAPAAQSGVVAATVRNDKMAWPVSGKVTSGFGRRGKRRFHAGIDIPMPKGTPIVAALDGIVLDVGTSKNRQYRGYGNTALIGHGNGIITLYAHCQSVSVKKGQAVRQGEVIGLVGNTGRSTTPHVHFEVRKDGKAVNPLPDLANRDSSST